MASTKVSKDYLSALRSFWEGRPQTAIEHLSLVLADEPERDDRFMMYRLWIEILADLAEGGTLKSLSDHLHILSLMNPKEADTYMALRGLISLEVDEVSAAKLYARGTQMNRANPYCEELRYRLERRLKDVPAKTTLARQVNQLEDYYHLVLVTQVAYLNDDSNLMEKTVKRTGKVFDNAPLHLHFQAHAALEKKDFEQASYFSKLLTDLYPTRYEYGVLAGYSMVRADKASEAIAVLERVARLGGERDPDVTSLLSCAHAQKYAATKEKDHLQMTKYYESKTRENLEEYGMGAMFFQQLNLNIAKKSNEAPMKSWLVKLNASKFHMVRDVPKADLESTMFPVDREAQPGDIVFLAGDDYRSEECWRIAAVFTITSHPQFDPINGFEASMELICRPEMSIPFDVDLRDGSQIQSGVIELDIDAIDLMSDAIQAYAEVDTGSGIILDEISKMRMSS